MVFAQQPDKRAKQSNLPALFGSAGLRSNSYGLIIGGTTCGIGLRACSHKPNVTQHIICSWPKDCCALFKVIRSSCGHKYPTRIQCIYWPCLCYFCKLLHHNFFMSVINCPGGNCASLCPAAWSSECACVRATEPCDSLSLSKIGDEVLAYLIASSMWACGCMCVQDCVRGAAVSQVCVCVCVWESLLFFFSGT